MDGSSATGADSRPAFGAPLWVAWTLAGCAAVVALEASQLVVRAFRPAWLGWFYPSVPETWTPSVAAHVLPLGFAVGALFGGAQWLALRGRLPRAGWWPLATAVGYALSWLLLTGPGRALVRAAADVLGAIGPLGDARTFFGVPLARALADKVLGSAVIAAAQWPLLRAAARGAWRWVAASALAAALLGVVDLVRPRPVTTLTVEASAPSIGGYAATQAAALALAATESAILGITAQRLLDARRTSRKA